MRPARDMPRPRRRTFRGGRVAIAIGLAMLIVLILSLRGVARIYTDYLWFDSLGRGDVWTGVVGVRIGLAVVFSVFFALLLWVNLVVADRLGPDPLTRTLGPEDELLAHYHRVIGPRIALVRTGIAALLGLIVGVPAANHWNEWILFRNAESFGIDDPLFHRDVGFYIFRLPFLSFVLDWAFGAVMFVLVLTAIAHYLNGGIRLQTPGERATPLVKVHVSVLLAALAVLKGIDYWFQRFELTTSTNGFVNGAGYTDVEARLPAINLLLAISLFSALLLVWNIRRRGWALPAVAVGLWAFVAILVGAIYPAFVQWRTVNPAESTREALYIERNIGATRAAFGLDTITSEQVTYDEDIDAAELRASATVLRNIRVLDPLITGEAFERLQRGRNVYRFLGNIGSDQLDVDRYTIDGELSSVVLGVRGLDVDNAEGWENKHVGFTHGYGIAVAPAQGTTASGAPLFIAGGLPLQSSEFPEPLDHPQIYVGENLEGYAIIGANREEVDYTSDDQQTELTTYEGEDGVRLDSFIRRASFALRFGQFEPLLSSFLTDNSRVIFNRDVSDRLETLAPFFQWGDPYPVVHDGRVVYIADGYTTTDDYPYAQQTSAAVRRGSGLVGPFNYVRNSVKAVVDAYDGTVTLYRTPSPDPIADAYERAFPDLFEPYADLPADLVAHLKYPDALFRVQTAVWSRYHVDESSRFHSGDNAWSLAQDPGREGDGSTTDTSATVAGVPAASNSLGPMDPVHGVYQLPGNDDAEFAALRAFVASASATAGEGSLDELTAFMVGRSDGANYGTLVEYEMLAGQQFDIASPTLADQRIRNEQDVGRFQTELGQRGSEVRFGEMQLVPIGNSIVYVRPLFVRAEGANAVPELEAVIVALGADVVMADDLESGLEELIGAPLDDVFDTDLADIGTDGTGGEIPDGTEGESTVPEVRDVSSLLAEALQLQAEADEALQLGGAGGLAQYAELQEQIRDLLEQAFEAAGGTLDEPAVSADPTSTTTTTEAVGDG